MTGIVHQKRESLIANPRNIRDHIIRIVKNYTRGNNRLTVAIAFRPEHELGSDFGASDLMMPVG